MFLGGLMFGYGMVLSNGCGSRALVLLGRGNLRSLVVVIVLGIFAADDLEGADRAGTHRRYFSYPIPTKVISLPALLSTLGLSESFARMLAAIVVSGA